MFRWQTVPDQTIFDMTVKMYREPFAASATIKSPFKNLEFDHYAYKYFQSELFMYRILDINFERYIEERGDISGMEKVLVPSKEDIASGGVL